MTSQAMHKMEKAAAQDFAISRLFEAPRALVWKAWTDPKLFGKWWGPKTFTNPVCEIDAREGGHYRVVMRSQEGIDYPIKGVFKKIKPQSEIVMTMDCSEHPEEWHEKINPDYKPGTRPHFMMKSTVTLEEVGDKTRLTVRMPFESEALRERMIRGGMNEGWGESFDKLAENINERDRRKTTVTRSFNHPAETVFDAWLDVKKAAQFLFATPSGEMVRAEIEPRIGGRYTFTEKRDGKEFEHTGVYLEIERPARLVFTFSVPTVNSEQTLVTIDVTPKGKGCELMLLNEGLLPEYESKTNEGWSKILDTLATRLG